jgi:murein DD-endopeptidase MepM/ murein hydrolase activator NlpD
MTRLPSRGTASVACLLLLLPIPLPASSGSPAPAQVSAGFQAAEPAYRWPLAGVPAVTRRFDPPAQRWLPGHRGVDLAGTPGAAVVAAGPGTVYFAGSVAGRGVVSVAHPDGLRTTYQPVTPVVSAGDPVAAGDPIGALDPGHAGCPVAACLHWGLRQGDSYLDPLALLGLGRVRLLPRDQA